MPDGLDGRRCKPALFRGGHRFHYANPPRAARGFVVANLQVGSFPSTSFAFLLGLQTWSVIPRGHAGVSQPPPNNNPGPSDARNIGLRLSTSLFAAFCIAA